MHKIVPASFLAILFFVFGCNQEQIGSTEGDNIMPIIDLYCKNLISCYENNELNYDLCVKGLLSQIDSATADCANSIIDYRACMNEQENHCSQTMSCKKCRSELDNYFSDCQGKKPPCQL